MSATGSSAATATVTATASSAVDATTAVHGQRRGRGLFREKHALVDRVVRHGGGLRPLEALVFSTEVFEQCLMYVFFSLVVLKM